MCVCKRCMCMNTWVMYAYLFMFTCVCAWKREVGFKYPPPFFSVLFPETASLTGYGVSIQLG